MGGVSNFNLRFAARGIVLIALQPLMAIPYARAEQYSPGRNGEIQQCSRPFQICEKENEVALAENKGQPINEEPYVD